MPQFDVSTWSSQVFWLIVSFIVMTVYLKKRILPKIDLLFQERHLKMNQEEERIKILQKRIEDLTKQKDDKLKEARHQAQHILTQTKEALQKDAEKVLKELDQDMNTRIHTFQEQLQYEYQNALGHLKEDQAPTVEALTQKFVHQRKQHE